MKKSNKKKTNKSDLKNNNSKPVSGQSSKMVVEKENIIVKWLKRIFNVNCLTLIAGAIAAAAAVCAIWPTPIKDLKEDINANAGVIESSFHPDAIIIDSTSTPDYQLIKDFQTSTLKLVTYWKSINNMQPMSKYKDIDLNMTINVIDSRLTTINEFDGEIGKVQNYISLITEYGQKNNISQLIPNYDKMATLYKKAGKRDEVFKETKEKATNDVMNVLLQYSTDMNSVSAKQLAKVVKPLDDLYNDKDVLDYINTLFSTAIELNTNYTDYLKHK